MKLGVWQGVGVIRSRPSLKWGGAIVGKNLSFSFLTLHNPLKKRQKCKFLNFCGTFPEAENDKNYDSPTRIIQTSHSVIKKIDSKKSYNAVENWFVPI